ncbi:MAG: hypothetical protein CVV64_20850 [Candidatus Wallbacteria bacterium HGW-Wallbacteria-1]|uniref:Uncharacterized protein n=1 Tax=Candidatus Wallbacteria bacterium HGW-Wallbacteria-1 TaxID=2013854 RepID=A0A2N1PHZ0_9BACT|nr:MAG: hypothetical protein CVV64_20850 [Candidatus Wallbacteria bacterium HGW-Wallbacteria-1]
MLGVGEKGACDDVKSLSSWVLFRLLGKYMWGKVFPHAPGGGWFHHRTPFLFLLPYCPQGNGGHFQRKTP